MSTDLLARIEADRQRYDRERAANRERFPEAMELIDALRAEGFKPKLKHAINAQGEEIGTPPKPEGLAVDGEKLAHLPEYEAFWQRSLGKKAETNATYRERMQRAIRPTRGNE